MKYILTVRGKRETWCFPVNGNPEFVTEWRADGLQVDELVNTIFLWAHQFGLTRVWCFLPFSIRHRIESVETFCRTLG